jgi:hypothetical protein
MDASYHLFRGRAVTNESRRHRHPALSAGIMRASREVDQLQRTAGFSELNW